MTEESQNPLVSIIIPCYNAERWLAEAVDSCLAQTYRPIEIIIVNDGSTDCSQAVIDEYVSRYPDLVRGCRQPNSGPAAARNRGLELAAGQYIQWLDADDLLEPDKIRPQAELLEQHPEIDAVYGDWKEYRYSAQDSTHVAQRRSFVLDPFLVEYVRGSWIALHAFLMRSDVAPRYTWDTALRALEDQDYWFQHALRGASFVHLKGDDCAVYRIGHIALTRNRVSRRWLEANLQLRQKIEVSLEKAGLIEEDKYRLAVATTYIGVAWRSFLVGYIDLGDICICHAEKLVSENELCRALRTSRACVILGLRRMLILRARLERMKRGVKELLYAWCSFDMRITWQDNVKDLFRGFHSNFFLRLMNPER